MNEIYLVWETVSEATEVYHLMQLSNEQFEKIRRCHGHFVNLDSTPEDITSDLVWLSKYLMLQKESIIYPNKKPIYLNISGWLVVCGWIL